MAEPITTAGRMTAAAPAAPPRDARREAIALIRSTLRRQDASDDEVDGALEALLELAKD